MITLDSIIVKNTEILNTQLDDEYVLMSIEKSNYYGIDSIGSRIWQLLENEISVKEICEKLTSEYDVEFDNCVKDVISFLDELNNENIITVKDNS